MVSGISASIVWIRKEECAADGYVKAPDFVEEMVKKSSSEEMAKNTPPEDTGKQGIPNGELIQQNTGKETEDTETRIKKVEEIDFMTVSSISFTENQILYDAKAFADAVPATDKADWQERKLQFFYAAYERSCEEEPMSLEQFINSFPKK